MAMNKKSKAPKKLEVGEDKSSIEKGKTRDLPIGELLEKSKITLKDSDFKILSSKGISTLRDVRKGKGLRPLAGLGLKADDEILATIESHARFLEVSDNVSLNEALIKNGFQKPIDLARVPRSRITKLLPKGISKDEGVKIHSIAKAQRKILANLIMGQRTKYANRYKKKPPGKSKSNTTKGASPSGKTKKNNPHNESSSGSSSNNPGSEKDYGSEKSYGSEKDPDIPDIPEDYVPCVCNDCLAAVSPLAYLADLIEYGTTYIKFGDGTDIDVKSLEEHFLQPFSALPADCDSVSEEIRQMRIVVEVLRKAHKIMGEPGVLGFVQKEADYRNEAYRSLLSEFGTSFEEIRESRTWSADDKDLLSERLGIVSGSMNNLNRLLLNPEGAPPADDAITEIALETIFGLKSTLRDELSYGPVLYPTAPSGVTYTSPTSDPHILRWSLTGVEWFRNSDASGRVYLAISKVNSKYTVKCYRNDTFTAADLVAEGETDDPQGTITLIERGYSGLGGTLSIDYKSDTHVILCAIPEFLAARLHNLRRLWRKMDWPMDDYSSIQMPPIGPGALITPSLPYINPDVIGPDDIRHPVNGDPVYELWKFRRAWMDSQLTEMKQELEANGLESLLRKISNQFDYGGNLLRAWPAGYDLSDFDTLRSGLDAGEGVETIKETIETTLRMDVDAFIRLTDLRAKDAKHRADPNSDAVSEEEWAEVLSILSNSRKVVCRSLWIEEEKSSADIEFGPKYFVKSLSEPQQGFWPPAQSNPLIDPDLVSIDDLPDSNVGQRARTLLTKRTKELKDLFDITVQFRIDDSYEGLLEDTFGVTIVDLENTLSGLYDSNVGTVENAKTIITDTYALTIDDFIYLMEMHEKDAQGDPALKPTDDEWLQAHSIITDRVKRIDKYVIWAAEETDAHTGVKYYEALKARLPLWRASAQMRNAWLLTLAKRSAPPIIDPDSISNHLIRRTIDSLDSYDIWYDRSGWVRTSLEDLKTVADAQTNELMAFNQMLLYALYGSNTVDRYVDVFKTLRERTSLEEVLKGVYSREIDVLRQLYNQVVAGPVLEETREEIQEKMFFDIDSFSRLMELDAKLNAGNPLSTAEKKEVDSIIARSSLLFDSLGLLGAYEIGVDIRPRLEQLGFDFTAYNRLMELRKLLANDMTILVSEWSDVYSILCQCMKRRQFRTWQIEEQEKGIALAPDHFQIREGVRVVRTIPNWNRKWLYSPKELRKWEQTLEGRIEQQTSIKEGYFAAVDNAEGVTLPLLRDALAMEIGPISGPREISKRFCIDIETSSCQKTTRISQAITTLQTLIWSTHIGLLSDVDLDTIARMHFSIELLLEAEDFDEEWKWMGSYETWRAAMFVFMYPENLLLPSLRRRQTAGFRKVVSAMRGSTRFSKIDACQIAQNYSDYLHDVANLYIESSCLAETRLEESECGSQYSIDLGTRELFYLFGRGFTDGSWTGYWSCYDPEGTTGYKQTFWEPIPGLNKNARQIVGAVPYNGDGGGKYICLVAIINVDGKPALILNRYDLKTRSWLGNEEPEPLDLPEGELYSATVSQLTTGTILIHIRVGDFTYTRQLNSGGDNWAEEEFMPFDYNISYPKAVYHLSTDRLLIITRTAQTTIGAWAFLRTTGKIRDYEGPYWKCYDQQFHFDDEARWIAEIGDPQGLGLGSQPFMLINKDKSAFKHVGGAGASVGYTANVMSTYPRGGDDIVVYWKESQDCYKRTVSMTSNGAVTLGNIVELGQDEWKRVRDISKTYYDNASRNDVQISYEYDHWLADPPDVGDYPPIGHFEMFHGSLDLSLAAFPLNNMFATLPKELSYDLHPMFFKIHDHIGDDAVVLQRQIFEYFVFLNVPTSFLEYLYEPYYYLRLQIAYQLQRNREFEAALDWYRTIYDYGMPEEFEYVHSIRSYINKRERYYGFALEAKDSTFERLEDWLLDPLNPHQIAATRADANQRFTLMCIVRCLLEYADSEYTRDTVESVNRAIRLYETAIDILNLSVLEQKLGYCEKLIGQLIIDLSDRLDDTMAIELEEDLLAIPNPSIVVHIIGGIIRIFESGTSTDEAYHKSKELIAESYVKPSYTIQDVLTKAVENEAASQLAILKNPETTSMSLAVAMKHVDTAFAAHTVISKTHSLKKTNSPSTNPGNPHSNNPGADSEKESSENAINGNGGYVPGLVYGFCIPPNPMTKFLKLHAELNLYKIRYCRNIAGLERKLEPYAAPTDTISGLPMLGGGEQIPIPGDITVFPTPYRYSYLIDRAKQYVQVAQQIEVAFLSALEKRDAEAYSILKARQDKQLARAGVRLQDLRVKGAKEVVTLAELQKERADIQAETYSEWIEAGLNEYELDMVNAYQWVRVARMIAVGAEALGRGFTALAADKPIPGWGIAAQVAFAVGAASEMTATYFELEAQIKSVYAAFERRKQEWELGKSLAVQDGRIALQQKKIAESNLKVVGQERNIAQMQDEFAEDTMNFLANKFTNVDLYDWMSRILEEVYCYFLEQATSIAILASNQLVFERQEQIPSIIKQDYWEAPSEESFFTEGEGPDRRGLTGSTRLLKDIYELDQYAFETKKRKLQLTKTFSLARLAPAEFQQFRETGVIRFSTPMNLFDQDFPGHFLRLIRQVRTSIIALIPPSSGIKATLATSGLSRVTVSGPIYQTVRLRRPPESVSLTSSINATGMFELSPDMEMLFPFEGLGVDTTWELRLPKPSNQFDFQTIADVLLTIDYTALESYDYQRQVISELDREIRGDLPVSIRFNFPDSWYHFHNPDEDDTRLRISFQTEKSHFPPNIDDLLINGVLLHLSAEDSNILDTRRVSLTFQEEGSSTVIGGEAVPNSGIISTSRGNAGGWTSLLGKTPYGEWEISLLNTPDNRRLVEDGVLSDILLVISYSGQTPEWPT